MRGRLDDCAVDAGEIAIGSIERVRLAIVNPSQGALDVFGVSLSGECPDLYIEGVASVSVGPEEEAEVVIVVRPAVVGSCTARVLVSSNARNEPRDEQGNSLVALTISATAIAGEGEGCRLEGACCCASGAFVDAPICEEGRLSCAAGQFYFDERCAEPAVCAVVEDVP